MCTTYRFPKLTFTVAVPIGETLLPSAFINWIPLVGRTCLVGIYLWATTEQEAPESNSIKVVWLLIFLSREQLLVWYGCLQVLVHIQSSRYFLVLGGTPCSTGGSTPFGVSLTPAITSYMSSTSTVEAFDLLCSCSTISEGVARFATCETPSHP